MKIKALAIAGVILAAGTLTACSSGSWDYEYESCPPNYYYDSFYEDCIYQGGTSTHSPSTPRVKAPKRTYKAPKSNTFKAPAPRVRVR